MLFSQIFSGQKPFHDITNDYQVVIAIQGGNRPSRPFHDLSRTRGLDDGIWNLIETCWTAESSGRPIAAQIVEQLLALPNQPVDRRPEDDYMLSPQVPQNQSHEPSSSFNRKLDDDDLLSMPSFSREQSYSSSSGRPKDDHTLASQVPRLYNEAAYAPSSYIQRSLGSSITFKLTELTCNLSALVRVTLQLGKLYDMSLNRWPP